MEADAWLSPSLSSGLPRFSAIITAASARWEALPAHEVALEDDAARASGGGPDRSPGRGARGRQETAGDTGAAPGGYRLNMTGSGQRRESPREVRWASRWS